jgi:probable HAF family extracellular repeat protein
VKGLFCFALVGGFSLSLNFAFAAAMYTVTPIDFDDSSLGSFATGISEAGEIAGYSIRSVPTGNQFDVYSRTANGNMQLLGTFRSARVGGIQSGGQFVGSFRPFPEEPDFVRYTTSSGFKTIGDLGGGATSANAINESGTIVGQSALTGANEANRAFRWTVAGGIVDLGVLPGRETSRAFGINDAGDIVGLSSSPTLGNRAVLWPSTGGMQEIGPAQLGRALDINNFGSIIGTVTVATGGYYFENGNTTFLPNLAGLLDGYTVPQALNDLGQVVGYSSAIAEFFTISENGFLWDETNGLRDLNDLIPENSGWFLGTAFDINNAGQIVGTGSFDGRTVGYLLTPIPEPAAGFLGISASALFLLRRRPAVC